MDVKKHKYLYILKSIASIAITFTMTNQTKSKMIYHLPRAFMQKFSYYYWIPYRLSFVYRGRSWIRVVKKPLERLSMISQRMVKSKWLSWMNWLVRTDCVNKWRLPSGWVFHKEYITLQQICKQLVSRCKADGDVFPHRIVNGDEPYHYDHDMNHHSTEYTSVRHNRKHSISLFQHFHLLEKSWLPFAGIMMASFPFYVK